MEDVLVVQQSRAIMQHIGMRRNADYGAFHTLRRSKHPKAVSSIDFGGSCDKSMCEFRQHAMDARDISLRSTFCTRPRLINRRPGITRF